MKKLLFLSIVSFFMASGLMAQEPISFEKVIQVDSVKKNDIYNGLKEWIGMNYRSAKSVIEVDDKEAGLIIISPRKDYSIGKLQYMCYDGTIKYTIKFQIKEGRFKVTITNFIHENDPGNKSQCQVGLITTSTEYDGQSSWGYKGPNNKIWLDVKAKSITIANKLFFDVGQITFSSNKVDSKTDNW